MNRSDSVRSSSRLGRTIRDLITPKRRFKNQEEQELSVNRLYKGVPVRKFLLIS